MKTTGCCLFILLIVLTADAESTKVTERIQYLCLPERFWTCNGVGECQSDSRPETLAAWKIDISASRYAHCSRDGKNCTMWLPAHVDGKSSFMFTVYDADNGNNPESFKIDPISGKFAAVRLSGGFMDPSEYLKKPSERQPGDLSKILVRQRTGSCIETQH